MAVNLIKKFSENKEKFAFGSIIAIAISAIAAFSTVRANKVDEEANKAKEEYYRKQLESSVSEVENNTDNFDTSSIIETTMQKKEAVITETKETTVQTETTLPETPAPEEVDPVPLMLPYDGYFDYRVENSAKLGGVEYKNVPTIEDYKDAFMVYNLESKYSKLEFDIGHIDGSYSDKSGEKCDCSFGLYLDNNEIQEVNLNANDLPTHITLDVTDCRQFKIQYIDDGIWSTARYGVINGTLYP